MPCDSPVFVIGLDVLLWQGSDPACDLGGEFFNDVGVPGDEVLFLAWIVDNVVEREFGSVPASRVDELPLAFTDAGIAVYGTSFPQERPGAYVLTFAEPCGRSVLGIEVGGVDLYASDGAQRRQEVDATDDGLVVHSVCGHSRE